MSAEQVIEQIRGLSTPDEVERVGRFLEEHRIELLADADAARRIAELRDGKVNALSHDEVFATVRNRLREA